MKIGILTQPLHNNYGGLLQNYALQNVLNKMGHNAITINRNFPSAPIYRKYASILHRIITGQSPMRIWNTKRENQIISQHTRLFLQENIELTPPITSTRELADMHRKFKFDAYVVGSDQVWRPRYSPSITNYFLDFVTDDNKLRKISYAASFGVNEWEFTPEQSIACKYLAQNFNAISVREDSAIDLCKQYLGVDAVHLLDPTMLLHKDDYKSLVEKKSTSRSSGNLFVYILDKTEGKKNFTESIVKIKKLKPFEVMPCEIFDRSRKSELQKCIFPPVEQWIRSFIDADFILTDSFHGTIFAILFGKPFLTVGNRERGLSRMTSLLKMFQLENRLIYEKEDLYEILLQQYPDFSVTHDILEEKRRDSIQFLENELTVSLL